MFKQALLGLALVIVMVGGVFFFGAPNVQAAAGDLQITVGSAADELGNSLTGGGWGNFNVTANCDGNGAGGSRVGDTWTIDVATIQGHPGGGCSNGDTVTISVSAGSGYVLKSFTTTYDSGSDPDTYSTGALTYNYTYKITGVTSEGTGASLISSLDSALVVGGATCTLSGGAYYCPVSANCSSATAYIVKNGYVATNYNISGVSECSSQVIGSVSNVQYAVKIYATNELGSAVTGATVGAGDNQMVSCAEGSSGYYYCAVPTAEIGTGLSIIKSGYVQITNTSGAYADRTANTDAQSTGTVTNFQYAHKILTSVTGATVTAGSGNTSCTASGSTYYCAVPATQDGGTNDIHVEKLGYVRVHGSTSDRTDNAAAQATEDLTATTVMGSSNPDSFGLKVTVSDELGNAMTGLMATFRGAEPTFTAGNSYYWADTNAEGGVLSFVKNGYVTKTDSTATTMANQTTQTYTGGTGVQYGYKITGIISETLSAALLASATTVELGDDTGLTACALSSGTYYCPVTLENSNGTIIAHIAVDGYVEKSNYATGFSSRTGSTAQQSGAVSSIQYAYKLNTFNAEATGSVTPSTVAVGVSEVAKISCTLNGGVWYCAVPLANSSGSNVYANVASDGFVQADHLISARILATAAQVTDTVSDIKYAYVVTGVVDELGNSLSPVTVTTGDSYGVTCVSSGSYWYCAVPLADTGITIKAEKDGYVANTSNTFSTDRTSAINSQQTKTVTGVKFAHKVSVSREADASALSGATVSTNGTDCMENGTTGIYYCAVPVANDNATISIAKNGYETNTSFSTTDRTVGADAQGTETAYNVLFQLKAVVTDELGNALAISGLNTATFNGSTPTFSSAHVAYWAVAPVSNATLVIQKDGYVDLGTTNTGLSDISTSASNDQTRITLGNNVTLSGATADGVSNVAKGLMFAQKVTVTRSGDNAALSGGTVTAAIGSNGSGGTVCSENGSTGVYYCAIPVVNSNTKTSVAKASYVTKEINFTARTAVTSGQVVLTAIVDGQHDNGSVTPTVSSQTPVDNSTGVAINIQPTITFNGPMNVSTLNSINVQLRKYSDDSQINANVLYNSLTDTVTLAPTANLENNTQYYLYVSGAKDTAGNTVTAYATKANQEFTTVAAGAAPTVTAQSPSDNATNIAVTIAPTITFSAAMDAATLNGGTIQLRKYSDDTAVGAAISYNPNSYVVTLTPNASLANNTQYYIWVSGAKNAAGITVTGYVTKTNQEFTTAAASVGSFGIISTTMTKMTGTADNTYANGWEWVIRMTLPTNQNHFALKFTDWVSGSNTLAAANNMEYYSEQVTEGTGSAGTPVSITAASTYPSNITVSTDVDTNTAGIQTDIHVKVKIPAATSAGSYSTSYRVNYE